MHLSSNSIREEDEIEKRGFLLRHKKASSSSFQDEPCFLSSSVTRDEKENENGFFAILEPLMDGCTFVPQVGLALLKRSSILYDVFLITLRRQQERQKKRTRNL